MNKLRAFWTRLMNTLGRAPYSKDFADELETHVAMDTERGVRNGLSPEEARRQSLIRFGGIAQAHDAYAERQGLPWLESLLRDVHYSLRSLVRNRLVTAVAILSIGLGVGSNTTIFSIVSRFVLRPAPVGDPGTLLSLHIMHDGDRCCNQFPWPVFSDVREQASAFSDVATYFNGRISWITYADRLMEFPSALLGVALGTILLPSLAKHYHDDNHGQYRALLDWGLRLTFLFALPATLALALLAVPLIATLYEYGRFTVADVWQTRAALLGYSVGLVGIITVKILAPGFYARHDMRTPVRSAFVALLVAQTLAVTLMFQIGHAGLTLATSTGAIANSLLLYRAMRRADIYAPLPGWGPFLRRVAVALVALAAVLWWGAGPDAFWTAAGLWSKVGRLALVIAGGALTYFGTLRLLGFRVADFNRREPS